MPQQTFNIQAGADDWHISNYDPTTYPPGATPQGNFTADALYIERARFTNDFQIANGLVRFDTIFFRRVGP
jgi:hypothetical protein